MGRWLRVAVDDAVKVDGIVTYVRETEGGEMARDGTLAVVGIPDAELGFGNLEALRELRERRSDVAVRLQGRLAIVRGVGFGREGARRGVGRGRARIGRAASVLAAVGASGTRGGGARDCATADGAPRSSSARRRRFPW